MAQKKKAVKTKPSAPAARRKSARKAVPKGKRGANKKAVAKRRAVVRKAKPAGKKRGAHKKAVARKAVAKKKVAKRKVAKKKVAKKKAVRRKAARKNAARKKPARKKVAPKKAARTRVANKKVAKKAAAKKVATKSLAKKPVPQKPAAKAAAAPPVPVKAEALKPQGKGRRKKVAPPPPPPPPLPPPARKRRITRMGLQEALISLETVKGDLEAMAWVAALYLIGPGLRGAGVHRNLSFMVVHKGFKTPSESRAAMKDLDLLLKRAIPIKRTIKDTDDATLVGVLSSDNPAVLALLAPLLGDAIPVFVR